MYLAQAVHNGTGQVGTLIFHHATVNHHAKADPSKVHQAMAAAVEAFEKVLGGKHESMDA